MINIGTHAVTITATGLSTAQTGTDQVVIEFTDSTGERIRDYLALTPKAWPYTLEKLRKCGWANEAEIELLAAEPSPLVGRVVEITVGQDGDRRRVKFYGPPPSGIGGGTRPASEVGARLRAAIGAPEPEKIPW